MRARTKRVRTLLLASTKHKSFPFKFINAKTNNATRTNPSGGAPPKKGVFNLVENAGKGLSDDRQADPYSQSKVESAARFKVAALKVGVRLGNSLNDGKAQSSA